MTHYAHRITIACPEHLFSDAKSGSLLLNVHGTEILPVSKDALEQWEFMLFFITTNSQR